MSAKEFRKKWIKDHKDNPMFVSELKMTPHRKGHLDLRPKGEIKCMDDYLKEVLEELKEDAEWACLDKPLYNVDEIDSAVDKENKRLIDRYTRKINQKQK